MKQKFNAGFSGAGTANQAATLTTSKGAVKIIINMDMTFSGSVKDIPLADLLEFRVDESNEDYAILFTVYGAGDKLLYKQSLDEEYFETMEDPTYLHGLLLF